MSKLSQVQPKMLVGPIFRLAGEWCGRELECEPRSEGRGASKDQQRIPAGGWGAAGSTLEVYLSQLAPPGRVRN